MYHINGYRSGPNILMEHSRQKDRPSRADLQDIMEEENFMFVTLAIRALYDSSKWVILERVNKTFQDQL